MKKNNKGFTLVELLAVIVILGLLMAIAIPSVTKYITQSRVKTLTTTMDSYVTAVVTQVNNGEYKFSDSTKVYAIPIECISLEKGGKSPFGNWMQANDDYWAYVLVHYNNVSFNYEYGFTFKDDAGYGLYPTLNSIIESSMVKTGYDDLTKPKGGLASNFVPITKWEGFELDETTELVVLEAESEGVEGNGQTTCTLCQKGENYTEVENSKIETNSTNLVEAIKTNNPVINKTPTLTKPSSATNEEDGLYSTTKTTNNSASYYFRGKVDNNVVFAGLSWKIIRINEDGTVRLILNNIIDNKNYKFNDTTADYKNLYYSNSSSAKPKVDAWYQSNIESKGFGTYVATGKFCEQSRVKYASAFTTGSATNAQISNYTPTFDCSKDGNGKGPLELKAGLITVDELIYAGAYALADNEEFYLASEQKIWTMSPAGVNSSGTAHVWDLRAGGFMLYFSVTGEYGIRPVINLKADVRATGTGTTADPYRVVTR